MKGLDILEYGGEGYDRTLTCGSWRVAFLNYAERFDRVTYLERHNLTDEVFVLLAGSATLLIGAEAEPVPMKPGKLYNVRAGTYHNIRVSVNAKVLVIENADTGRENSDYMEYGEDQK